MRKVLYSLALLLSASLAQAGSTQFSVTVDPQSALRNPVSGAVAVEGSFLRAGVSLGTDKQVSGVLDLVGRTRGGLILGVGVVADRLLNDDYAEVTVGADSATTVRPHDHGKHKGDHHVRGNRTFTTTRSYMSVLSLGGVDLGLSSSLFVGVGGPRGLFAESRALFNGGDVSNRVSVGVRF